VTRRVSAGKDKSSKSPRSPGRPKREDVAAMERKLFSVALNEFTAHGYGAASLTKIVKIAGVAKTTLYARFSSKEQLFRAIMQQQIERADAATALRPGANRPGANRIELEKGLEVYANRMLEVSLRGDLRDVNRLISSESHRFPELGAAAVEKNRLGVKRIANFISDCADADGIRCKDPEAVAETFIFMLRGWYVNAMMTSRNVSAAERKQWVGRAVRILLSARSNW
jgi:TetR/AcrR family transcriptional regulator, mexJK operon transcriptional repressor